MASPEKKFGRPPLEEPEPEPERSLAKQALRFGLTPLNFINKLVFCLTLRAALLVELDLFYNK